MNLPWKKSTSIYDDDGPAESVEFEVEGHRFKVKPTELVGCDTFRRRYWVECLTCNEVLHEATTSATILVKQHIEPYTRGRNDEF